MQATNEVAASLIGLDISAAMATIKSNSLKLRVVEIDGEELAHTQEFIPTRVNVAIEAGIVVEVKNLG